MNFIKTNKKQGITKIEVLIIVVFAFFLCFLITYEINRGKKRPLSCINNLRQIYLGFRLRANDFNNRFPWQVPPEEGGSKDKPIAYQFFAARNEIGSPRVCLCPADARKTETGDWEIFLKHPERHLSYFYSPDAGLNNPKMPMLGDRNILMKPKLLSAKNIKTETAHIFPRWDSTIHTNRGYIVLSEGSIIPADNRMLAALFKMALTNGYSNDVIRIEYP